jgi:hypothetical protein
MSFLCGCFASADSQHPHVRTQAPYDPQAGFVRRDDHVNLSQYPNDPSMQEADGYLPVIPLPRYTPRPVSIHEKTLQSSSDHDTSGFATPRHPDEKNRRDFEEPSSRPATEDDASSAFSFPSSFGHTSTDTRDTPPPPYSSCTSLVSPRSRASSMNHRPESWQMPPHPTQPLSPITLPPMVHISQPRPIFRPTGFASSNRGTVYPGTIEDTTGDQRRISWDS